MKKVAARRFDFAPHAQDCMLTRRPYPEMTEVEKKCHSMFLGRYRVIHRGRVDGEAFDGKLAAARRALILVDEARNFQRGFLAEMVSLGKRICTYVSARGDALAQTAAVAK